eukprot:7441784-Pyramimonas_sp.AAC.1
MTRQARQGERRERESQREWGRYQKMRGDRGSQNRDFGSMKAQAMMIKGESRRGGSEEVGEKE